MRLERAGERVLAETSPATAIRDRCVNLFRELQDQITKTLEVVDGKGHFQKDIWKHEQGGGGTTRILQNGHIFEKAGVSTSSVSGALSDLFAGQLHTDAKELYATGISLVLHPSSPMIPTVHMNLRYIELSNGDAWFGGGADLTPYYLFEDDARHFHSTLKNICDGHSREYYPRFKKWCDEYFFLKHRSEARGVGGIFFDYVRENLERFFPFVEDLGNGFLGAYLPILECRKNEPYGEEEKNWQLIRRGRYVEFNLLQDRGTLFGLETRGRTESILMSLPPEVKWSYNYRPSPGSREEALLTVLRHPKEWV
jgi:coproporphyrinogen III oxidase